MEGRYLVKDIARVVFDGVEYTGNAALYVMLQQLPAERVSRRFIQSIARGEDSARG